MKNVALAAMLGAALLAGCGDAANDPADTVRNTALERAADARAGHWGDYCAGTTDPAGCQESIATAQAMGVDLVALVPSEKVAEGMRVKVDGDRATVDATAAEDVAYVLRGERWLMVWEDQ